MEVGVNATAVSQWFREGANTKGVDVCVVSVCVWRGTPLSAAVWVGVVNGVEGWVH